MKYLLVGINQARGEHMRKRVADRAVEYLGPGVQVYLQAGTLMIQVQILTDDIEDAAHRMKDSFWQAFVEKTDNDLTGAWVKTWWQAQ